MIAAEEQRIPVYFFRFEDLLNDPYPVFKQMFEFLLGVENIEGTFIDHRIKQKITRGIDTPIAYKPRQGAINKNIDKYSPKQLELFKTKLEHWNKFFGYARIEGQPSSEDHTFFDY